MHSVTPGTSAPSSEDLPLARRVRRAIRPISLVLSLCGFVTTAVLTLSALSSSQPTHGITSAATIVTLVGTGLGGTLLPVIRFFLPTRHWGIGTALLFVLTACGQAVGAGSPIAVPAQTIASIVAIALALASAVGMVMAVTERRDARSATRPGSRT
ncbi:MAG: hypothetical protein ACTJHU_09140 [Mycetocola sp.]